MSCVIDTRHSAGWTDLTVHSGPSMCPGADDESLDLVLPFFQKVAAKDKNGNPCVAKAGTGGAGHYVKMIHNGIEHGMMSAISEAWSIMVKGLGMSYEEIGDVFSEWNSKGELVCLPLPLRTNASLTDLDSSKGPS